MCRPITHDDLYAAIRTGRRFDGLLFLEHDGLGDPNDPPWLRPIQPSIQRSSSGAPAPAPAGGFSVKTFEQQADRARLRLQGCAEGGSFPLLPRSELLKALARAVFELRHVGLDASKATDQLRMTTGLQLVGVRIAADDAKGGDPSETLDLTGADLPFSLRLLCCVVEVPLALSNLSLVSLDLSGSALVGVDAPFLRARGSVRMRRTYSEAPVDFAGAQIHGYFDASEALLQPFGRLPASQSVDGERAMLNLSQATIDNEIRMIGATIWGGLAMRGLTARRSLYLDHATILSPLGVLEAMLASIGSYPEASRGMFGAWPIGAPTGDRLCSKRFKDIAKKPSRWKALCLHLLLTENLRLRTSAIRGDGVRIAGSLFASGLQAHGRVRLKYGRIEGGVTLHRALLRSPEALRRPFDALAETGTHVQKRIGCYRRLTYDAVVPDEQKRAEDDLAVSADAYALDLREASIGGSLRIGMRQEGSGTDAVATRIDGVVGLSRAHVDGELFIDHTRFAWTWRVRKPEGTNKAFAVRYAEYHREHRRSVRDGKRHALEARALTTSDTVSLRGCRGLQGADFGNAEIGGDLLFFDGLTPDRPGPETQTLTVIGAASTLSGRLNLQGTRVAGDCRLLFDADLGPFLDAERLQVAGILSLAPRRSRAGWADYVKRLNRASNDRQRLRANAAEGSNSWETALDQNQKHPHIDLTNARAGLFEHPPMAWPRAGQLLITGFRYTRALAHGPLAPHPAGSGPVPSLPTRWQEERDGAKRLTQALLLLVMLLVALLVVGQLLKPPGWDWGAWETLSLTLLCVAAIAYRTGRTWTPAADIIRPMAIAWLDLQAMSRNAYRTDLDLTSHLAGRVSFFFSKLPGPLRATPRASPAPRSQGNTIHSLEPYLVAAAALREEGRWISANLVERQRLLVRTRQLSWRGQLLQKLLFQAVGGLADYGFSLARPLFATALLVVLGGMLGHHANANGWVAPKAYRIVAAGTAAGGGTLAAGDPPERAAADCRPEQQRQTEFTPLRYALDTVVPFVNLGEGGEWDVVKCARPASFMFTYETLFGLLRLAGLTVVTLLLLGLSTRFGLVFNRYSE